MTIGLWDSGIYGRQFGGALVSGAFSDAARIQAMIEVEAALARVQGRLGVIPADAAAGIDRALQSAAPDMAKLAAGVQADGVPVPALVMQLRSAVGGEAAQFLHWGATSQDILDTALMLQLRTVLDGLESRLSQLIGALAAIAEAHRSTVMVARTRSQQALPTSFGYKVACWLLPLLRHRARLAELRPRLLCVQLGGGAGTLSVLGEHGIAVMEALAHELGLGIPPCPWHSQRDALAETGGWLSLVSGSLGKLGHDVVLLAQTEIGELRESGESAHGGSSTLPQKANPVTAELLVTLARHNAGLLGNLHQAQIQEQERGGAGWQLEWLTLPPMLAGTAAGLARALWLVENLAVDADRMRANLDASRGLVLAEAAVFALAAHMPRPDAQALVRQAARDCAAGARHLFEVLAERSPAPVDWAGLRDYRAHLGSADSFLDRVLALASG